MQQSGKHVPVPALLANTTQDNTSVFRELHMRLWSNCDSWRQPKSMLQGTKSYVAFHHSESAAGKIAAVLAAFNSTQLAWLKIKLNCIQVRSVWIMELCAPRGKVLFVVCPSVRSRIGESASLSRSAHPVNDNPMEWPICGAKPAWKRRARFLDEA